jgi:hypothetical protein
MPQITLIRETDLTKQNIGYFENSFITVSDTAVYLLGATVMYEPLDVRNGLTWFTGMFCDSYARENNDNYTPMDAWDAVGSAVGTNDSPDLYKCKSAKVKLQILSVKNAFLTDQAAFAAILGTIVSMLFMTVVIEDQINLISVCIVCALLLWVVHVVALRRAGERTFRARQNVTIRPINMYTLTSFVMHCCTPLLLICAVVPSVLHAYEGWVFFLALSGWSAFIFYRYALKPPSIRVHVLTTIPPANMTVAPVPTPVPVPVYIPAPVVTESQPLLMLDQENEIFMKIPAPGTVQGFVYEPTGMFHEQDNTAGLRKR